MVDDRATEIRRVYLQNWRRKNPDKVKQYNREYWERRARKEADKDAEATPAKK